MATDAQATVQPGPQNANEGPRGAQSETPVGGPPQGDARPLDSTIGSQSRGGGPPPVGGAPPAGPPPVNLRMVPGFELIGRGIYLRPRTPYELKLRLFKLDFDTLVKYDGDKSTNQIFLLPPGVEVNNSPPMPGNRAINKVNTVDSWERLDKSMSVDAGISGSNQSFSIDVNASRANQLHSEDAAFYALRNSFVPLFSVDLPERPTGIEQADIESIEIDGEKNFRHRYRASYDKFFEKYGTHYVKRIWVGGSATVAYSVLKSSNMSQEDVQLGLRASMVGVGSASVNVGLQSIKEKLQTQSDCTVWGNGGDSLALAKLSSLDNEAYNEWLSSVKENPEAIELELAGIWTLLCDRDNLRAKALMKAYATATTFTLLTAVFPVGNSVFFLQSNKIFSYDIIEHKTVIPRDISEVYTGAAKYGFDRIDAAFSQRRLATDAAGDENIWDVYLFRRDMFLKLAIEAGGRKKNDGENADEEDEAIKNWGTVTHVDQPCKISELWPHVGKKFDRIDAVLNVDGTDDIYIFRKEEYIRVHRESKQAYDGYPKKIAERWAGIIFDRIDAVVYWGNDKVYFFRGDQYIRYDMVNYRADGGYPKFIPSGYVEDWEFFD